jgi:hypothetical protein
MAISILKRSLGSRLFWLGFGTLLGLPQLLDGLRYQLNGELFFGLGMLLLGISGFLRPVQLTRALNRQLNEESDRIAIGSPKLHGALSLVMLALLVTGLAIKFAARS